MSRRVIIEEILPLDELRELVPAEDWAAAQQFSSQHRQCEWLSWRVVLRRTCGAESVVAYNDVGAPYIVGSKSHISVSHTLTHVAILIDTKPCAIDMELLKRNYTTIKRRYIAPCEEQIIDNTQLTLAIAWCAKEAAYKIAARQGVDFLRDITITNIDHARQTLTVKVCENIMCGEYLVTEDYVVVTL